MTEEKAKAKPYVAADKTEDFLAAEENYWINLGGLPTDEELNRHEQRFGGKPGKRGANEQKVLTRMATAVFRRINEKRRGGGNG